MRYRRTPKIRAITASCASAFSLVMTAGLLMSSGFDAINIPHARRLEFNHALDVLFETDDASELLRFLVSCAN